MSLMPYCDQYNLRNPRGLLMREYRFSFSLENTVFDIRFLLLQAEILMASTVITV